MTGNITYILSVCICTVSIQLCCVCVYVCVFSLRITVAHIDQWCEIVKL